MPKTMTKTKTKTLVAIALVTLAVVGTVAGLTIINKRTGEKSSGSSSNYLLKGKGITDSASSGTANQATATCGNGKLEQGEECDDGNKVSGDGCTGCPTGCQTSLQKPILGFNTATAATACTTANDCATNGYAGESWTCKNGTCQAASCGDGTCNRCEFSPCSANAENQNNCSRDCGSPATPEATPTPSVTPSTTTPTADQCKACVGGCRKESGATATSGLQGTKLQFNVPSQHWPLAHGQSKLLHVTVPACNTVSKQVRFSLGGLQSNPTAQILVKKIMGDPARIPTKADFDRFYALTGRDKGPYATGDGFFWKFDGDANGVTVAVYSNYDNFRLGAPMNGTITIPNFNQAGDYYLYVINTGSYPTDTRSMEVYVGASCY